jgi:DnaJ-domain-containing protein 1
MDAQQLSAELNAARATLANPESRAEALLSFAGGAPAGSERTLPEGFLSQMMELRESMEVDMASGDARALDRWHDYVNERRAHFIAMLSTLFSTPSPLGAEQRREIRMQLNAWRYIERLIEQLEPRASSQA